MRDDREGGASGFLLTLVVAVGFVAALWLTVVPVLEALLAEPSVVDSEQEQEREVGSQQPAQLE